VTPNNNIKFKGNAQIRAMDLLTPATDGKRINCEDYVEGYAAKYAPYVLYEDQDGPVYERFEPEAFANCDIGDVIMQYDHAGRVLARMSNKTLIVEPDPLGLFMAADLGQTDAARQIYGDITTGMVQKMSWRFLLGDYEYDPSTRTIIHHTVKRIYDVSAVSIPANENTEINARSWADGVIDTARRSDRELEDRRRRLQIQISEMIRRIHNNENC
jgi:phage prohead protease, HK97 family